jgi:hypothetical protein
VLHLALAQMLGLWHTWHSADMGTETPRQGLIPCSYSLKAEVREISLDIRVSGSGGGGSARFMMSMRCVMSGSCMSSGSMSKGSMQGIDTFELHRKVVVSVPSGIGVGADPRGGSCWASIHQLGRTPASVSVAMRS